MSDIAIAFKINRSQFQLSKCSQYFGIIHNVIFIIIDLHWSESVLRMF